jgi:hypothetical protein
MCLNSTELQLVQTYKYLGLVFQSDGKWNAQFDSVVAKANITANLIARINHRNLPPEPMVTATLVRYILIPQIAYSIHLWRPTKAQFRVLNQIIANPLRRALGLHRTASAIRTLWEFGIPTIETIRLTQFLQSLSRAMRSAYNGNFLPAILAGDIADPGDNESARYCRPISTELAEIRLQHPSAARLPLDKKQAKSISIAAMTKAWNSSASAKARSIKPDHLPARYISVDTKPTVCIRARLRLDVALTPRRKLIYRLVPNDVCCGESGNTEHVLMRCNKYTAARTKCSNDLLNLYIPITLTLSLLLGLPPPPPIDPSLRHEKAFLTDLHDSCLHITGAFLLHIDKVSHL